MERKKGSCVKLRLSSCLSLESSVRVSAVSLVPAVWLSVMDEGLPHLGEKKDLRLAQIYSEQTT